MIRKKTNRYFKVEKTLSTLYFFNNDLIGGEQNAILVDERMIFNGQNHIGYIYNISTGSMVETLCKESGCGASPTSKGTITKDEFQEVLNKAFDFYNESINSPVWAK